MTIRRRGFLTPDAAPDALLCRAFSLPNDTRWLGNFMGALQALVDENNWEQFGTLTPEEAAAAYRAIIDAALPGNVGECTDDECAFPETPEGTPVFRLSALSLWQQIEDEAWTEPTGEYEIEPVAQRTEPTEEDRICAAAANCAHVLEVFYENVSDSYNDGLSTAEAAEAFAIVVAAQFGSTGIGLVIAAALTIGILIFGVLLAVMAFVGADLWTAGFTRKLVCILIDNATETDERVHFDFDGVIDDIAAQTSLEVTFSEIRLFGQLRYLFAIIGSEGLDAAGATTAIDPAFCPCDEYFCIEILSPVQGLDPVVNCAGAPNTWFNSFMVVLNDSGFSGIFQIDRLEMDIQYSGAGTPAGEAYFVHSNSNCGFDFYYTAGVAAAGLQRFVYEPTDWYDSVNRIRFSAACSNNESNSAGNILQFKRIKIEGHALTGLPDNLAAFADYNCL